MKQMFVLVAALGLLTWDPARADDVVHCPRPGTVIVREPADPLHEMRFILPSGDFCQAITDDRKRPQFFRGVWTRGELPYPEALGEVAKLWPLEVGNEVTFTAGEAVRPYDYRVRVERREIITTKAGTFDTFVITQNRFGTKNIAGLEYLADWDVTRWYAPELGTVVKQETHNLGGVSTHWEVTSITHIKRQIDPEASSGSGMGPGERRRTTSGDSPGRSFGE